jgi:hypothetical protein
MNDAARMMLWDSLVNFWCAILWFFELCAVLLGVYALLAVLYYFGVKLTVRYIINCFRRGKI